MKLADERTVRAAGQRSDFEASCLFCRELLLKNRHALTCGSIVCDARPNIDQCRGLTHETVSQVQLRGAQNEVGAMRKKPDSFVEHGEMFARWCCVRIRPDL